MKRRIWLHFVLITLTLWLGGCASQREAPPSSVPAVGNALAQTKAHVESAEYHVTQAIPHADDAGKASLDAASHEHAEAIKSTNRASSELQHVNTELATIQGKLTDAKTDYSKLEGKWYVRWGRRIERAILGTAIIVIVLEILSLLIGWGNPLGWLRRSLQAIDVVPWFKRIFGYISPSQKPEASVFPAAGSEDDFPASNFPSITQG